MHAIILHIYYAYGKCTAHFCSCTVWNDFILLIETYLMKRFNTGLSFETKAMISQKKSVGARKMVWWLKHTLVLQRTWIWWFPINCSLSVRSLAPLISIAACIHMHGSINLHTTFWKSQSFFFLKIVTTMLMKYKKEQEGKKSQNYFLCSCSLLMLEEEHGSQDLTAVWDSLRGPRVLWLFLRGSFSCVLPEHPNTNAKAFY